MYDFGTLLKEWAPRYLTALARLLSGDQSAARTELEAALSLSHGNALVERALRRMEAGSKEGLDELFVALPQGAESAAVEEGAFRSMMGRAEREFAAGKYAEACASAMKARGVKGYERSAEALEFLRRVGSKGARAKLLGGWQKGHFEGSEGALSVAMPPDLSQVALGPEERAMRRHCAVGGWLESAAALPDA